VGQSTGLADAEGRRTWGCAGSGGGAGGEQSGKGCGAMQAVAAEGPVVSNPTEGCRAAQAASEGCGAAENNRSN
jgi:hypothetical protein